MTIQDLPALNAVLNSISAVFLLLGWGWIRAGRKDAHRNCMICALVTSTLFLASYLTYHFKTEAVTRFVEPAWFRPFYLVILITHLILAIVIVPMVVVAVGRAVRGRFEAHRRIARWLWPMWMYVSVTGVIIYLLLYQIFPQK